MYQCTNCKGIMSQPLDRCPHCGILLSGVKCEGCGYVGGKSEFINNGHRCPKCNSTIHIPGTDIPRLTRFSTTAITSASQKSPMLAAVLSFIFLGGAGQLYLGQWKKGFTIIATAFVLSAFLMSIPVGIIGVFDAYGTAQKLNAGEKMNEWKFNVNWKVAGILILLYVILICGIFLLPTPNPP